MACTSAHYQHLLAGCRPVSRDEEAKLIRLAQPGTPRERGVAEHLLVRANTRFVFKVAHHYAKPGTEKFDLVFTAGMRGMLRSIRDFEPERKLKLISYAVWWMRQAILLDLAEEGRRFAGLTNIYDRIRGLTRTLESFPDQESAEALEIQRKLTEIDLALGPPTIRIGTESKDTYGSSEIREVEDARGMSSFRTFEAMETNTKLLALSLTALDSVDLRIVSLRYGLDGGETHSLEEIGDALPHFGFKKLSKERIRQLLARSMHKMRAALNKRNIQLRDMCAAGDLALEVVGEV
jgi:RNA polymerase primary sigma factor